MPFFQEENDREVLRGYMRPNKSEIQEGDILRYDPHYEVEGEWEQARGKAFEVISGRDHYYLTLIAIEDKDMRERYPCGVSLPHYAFKIMTREADWEV